MSMNRRSFVKAISAVSALLFSGVASALELEKKDVKTQLDISKDLERSIQASFGSEFKVLEHTRSGDRTIATIEHLENHYCVVSENLSEWQIVSSSLI